MKIAATNGSHSYLMTQIFVLHQMIEIVRDSVVHAGMPENPDSTGDPLSQFEAICTTLFILARDVENNEIPTLSAKFQNEAMEGAKKFLEDFKQRAENWRKEHDVDCFIVR
jgi:hypothetical protein